MTMIPDHSTTEIAGKAKEATDLDSHEEEVPEVAGHSKDKGKERASHSRSATPPAEDSQKTLSSGSPKVLGDSQTTHNIPTYAYGAYIGKEQDENAPNKFVRGFLRAMSNRQGKGKENIAPWSLGSTIDLGPWANDTLGDREIQFSDSVVPIISTATNNFADAMMSFVDRCTEMALEHKKSFGDLSVDDYYSLSFDFSMTQDFPLGSARSTINVESIDQPHASPTTKAKKRKQGSLESESAVPAATNRKILPVPSSSRLRQEDLAERKNGTASTTPPLIIRLPPLRALASGHRSSHSNPSQAAATIPIAGPSNASLPTQVLFPTTNLGDGSSISPADLSASPTLRRSQSSGYCPPGPRSNPLNSSGQNSPPTSEATPSRLSENNNQFVTRTRSISGRAYPTIPAPAPRASVTRSLERSSSGHEHSAIVRGGQRSEDHGHGQTLR